MSNQFVASPTMSGFMASDKYARVLAGPVGSGKSVCCSHELLHWAAEQQPNSQGVRKTRFLIVRNTADQLKSTTMKTVFDWLPPGVWGEYKITDKTYYVRFRLSDDTVVNSEWMFIALDTPDDVRKALSLEATGLWGNEARELHQEVVDGLLMRLDRYPSPKDGGATRPGAIFDTNMPDVDTWWHKQMEAPPTNWGVFVQPPGIITRDEYITRYLVDPDEARLAVAFDGTEYVSNPESDNYGNLSARYYPNIIPGKTQDFLDVYLRCKYGRDLKGLPVYDKTYRQDFHESRERLLPIQSMNYPIVMGLDFGRTPAAVFGQITPAGRVNLFSEVTAENMGIEKFIQSCLRPHINERYLGYPILVAPDPAGWQKTQVVDVTPVDVLQREGFRVVPKFSISNNPKLRIQGVEKLLTGQIDGGPAFMIDAENCPVTTRGFRYGYRWKLNRNGTVEDDVSPVKNEFSHPHDACQYLAQVVGNGASGVAFVEARREVQAPPMRWAI